MTCAARPPAVWLLLLASLLLTACGDPPVVAYRIPKETPPPAVVAASMPPAGHPALPPAAPAAMSDTPVAVAQGAPLSWTAPEDWQSKPATGMRKATYTVTGADGATAELAVTAFPGDVGGELGNVNRWRGQLQLPPLTADALDAAVTRFTAQGLTITVVDLENASAPAPQRMLGAMVPIGGATWFFKLLGPASLVAAQKPAFLEFIHSVQPAPVSP